MRKSEYALIVLAALILAAIVTISPKVKLITDAASGEVYGVDIIGLIQKAQDLPEQHYAAH